MLNLELMFTQLELQFWCTFAASLFWFYAIFLFFAFDIFFFFHFFFFFLCIRFFLITHFSRTEIRTETQAEKIFHTDSSTNSLPHKINTSVEPTDRYDIRCSHCIAYKFIWIAIFDEYTDIYSVLTISSFIQY